MMCGACKRNDHANCGLQTWCDCECDGTSDWDWALTEDSPQAEKSSLEKEAVTRNTLNLQMALEDLQKIRETLSIDWFFEQDHRVSHALANLAEALEDHLYEADGRNPPSV